MQRDQTYLLDILSEARALIGFVKDATYAEFIADARTRRAVERSFEIIGEASKAISIVFRESHPEFPWRWMADMRNLIVHEYRKVNYAVLWETIRHDIPDLIRLIEPLVPPEDAE